MCLFLIFILPLLFPTVKSCIATISPDGRPGDGSSGTLTTTTTSTTTTTTTTTTTQPITVCTPLGSTWIYNPANGYCYYVGTGIFQSWFAAENTCVGLGAHLTSILDQAENDFIVMITTGGATSFVNILDLPWIGLGVRTIATFPFFEPYWTDGTPYGGYSNFPLGLQPSLATACTQLFSDLPFAGFAKGIWYPTVCVGLVGKYVCKRLP